MLTQQQISLIQCTWTLVQPVADQAADTFYTHLFSANPELRTLFPLDLSEQKRKLMQMLGIMVKNVHRLEVIEARIRSLGARHLDYGARPEDYALVGEALLGTLETGLGEHFTAEVRAAWAELYAIVSEKMQPRYVSELS